MAYNLPLSNECWNHVYMSENIQLLLCQYRSDLWWLIIFLLVAPFVHRSFIIILLPLKFALNWLTPDCNTGHNLWDIFPMDFSQISFFLWTGKKATGAPIEISNRGNKNHPHPYVNFHIDLNCQYWRFRQIMDKIYL